MSVCIAFLDFAVKWIESLPIRTQAIILLCVIVALPILWVAHFLWSLISFGKDVIDQAKKPWYGDDDAEE